MHFDANFRHFVYKTEQNVMEKANSERKLNGLTFRTIDQTDDQIKNHQV
jgi:hypothetical protein